MSEPFPTKEDFDGWLQLPLTRMVLRTLPARKIQQLQSMWSDGRFSYTTIEACALKNAEKIGEVNCWKDLQEFDYDALLTELADDSKYGAEPIDDSLGG